MNSPRLVTLVYAAVLAALTASTCTFFYALSLATAPAPDVSVPSRAMPPPRIEEDPASTWTLQEEFESLEQVALPDEFAPPELYMPTSDSAQRFAVRHPDYAPSRTRLPIFEVIIGGPGMYPPVRLLTDEDGEFATSLDIADMLDGAQVESLEIFVREKQRGRHTPLGLWREVEVSALEEGSCVNAMRCKILPLWDVLPMVIEVRNAAGDRLAHASAKLSLESVGMVHLKEKANSGGDIVFGGIPEGNYTLSIKAAGYLREEFEISHVSPLKGLDVDDSRKEFVRHEVILEEGRSLYGRVVDAKGEGIEDAFVTVYVDRYGSPNVLSVESFSRIDSVPVRGIATTVDGGYFSVSGLPKGIAYVTATGTLGVPALSRPLDLREVAELGPVQVVLEDGSDVEVLVTGPDGPVANAEVSWRDEQTGLRASFTTARDGVAIFEDVPPQAVFRAELERWSARGRGLEAPDEDGVYRLELELERPGSREDIALRLLTPMKSPVMVRELSFRAEQGGEVCEATKIERRDWMFERCKAGRGWLEVHTDLHGTWSELIDLDHGVIVTMPEPLEVEVTWRNWGTPPERMMIEDVLGERERGVTLSVLDRRGEHRFWKGVLYPGRYSLEVNTTGKTYREVFMVQQESRELDWEPVSEHTMHVDVVDERYHPLSKSYFAVIRGGRHVDVRTNNAAHLVPLSSKDPGNLTLLACGATSGCATHRIGQEDLKRDKLLLTTSGSALSGVETLDGITDVDALSELLGAPLVQDHFRLLVDVKDPKSLAAKLGVPRGAALIYAAKRRVNEEDHLEALVVLPDHTWKLVTGKIK